MGGGGGGLDLGHFGMEWIDGEVGWRGRGLGIGLAQKKNSRFQIP